MAYDGQNFPFLSTLIHELGHAFGRTHADCHGYDMVSSKTRLWSKGFSLSVPPPVFNPEEYLMLAQNKLAFPNFNFIPARHNPSGKSLAWQPRTPPLAIAQRHPRRWRRRLTLPFETWIARAAHEPPNDGARSRSPSSNVGSLLP